MTFRILPEDTGQGTDTFSIQIDHGNGLTEYISGAHLVNLNVQRILDEPTKITIDFIAPSLISAGSLINTIRSPTSSHSKINEKLKLGDS